AATASKLPCLTAANYAVWCENADPATLADAIGLSRDLTCPDPDFSNFFALGHNNHLRRCKQCKGVCVARNKAIKKCYKCHTVIATSPRQGEVGYWGGEKGFIYTGYKVMGTFCFQLYQGQSLAEVLEETALPVEAQLHSHVTQSPPTTYRSQKIPHSLPNNCDPRVMDGLVDCIIALTNPRGDPHIRRADWESFFDHCQILKIKGNRK
ncbi:hypothetical protein KIPB_016536, partial [Kipferlia bialata]